MSFFDGHDALIGREDDSHVELRSFSADTIEVMSESEEHPFGALDVKAEIALCSVAEFFREVYAAVPTIGVREEVKDIDARDIAQCGEHLIESLSTFSFCKQNVNTPGWPVDGFSEKFSTIPSFLDEITDYRINATVIAGHKRMFLHDSSLLLIVKRTKETGTVTGYSL